MQVTKIFGVNNTLISIDVRHHFLSLHVIRPIKTRPIQLGDEFTYLGSVMTEDGKCKKDVKRELV